MKRKCIILATTIILYTGNIPSIYANGPTSEKTEEGSEEIFTIHDDLNDIDLDILNIEQPIFEKPSEWEIFWQQILSTTAEIPGAIKAYVFFIKAKNYLSELIEKLDSAYREANEKHGIEEI
jgi:hypothetical protein